jgi:hypothetical protein
MVAHVYNLIYSGDRSGGSRFEASAGKKLAGPYVSQ